MDHPEERTTTPRPWREELRWMAVGALLLVVVFAVIWIFRRHDSPEQQLAFKATRVDVVSSMEVALARGSVAEKSAVLAATDQESQEFADQARAAASEVDGKRQDLAKLLDAGGTQREKELLAQFSQAFADSRRIEEEVLGLAVRNTNLKAYGLLFGPAAASLAEMNRSLDRIVASAGSGPGAKQIVVLAMGAETAVQRIHILLAPHIAEESDPKMDDLEGAMRKDEAEVRKDLDALAALAGPERRADVAAAASELRHYEEIKAQIVTLSRENTNVRSLALSLNQKRKANLLCLDTLSALKQAILDEPIAGVTYGRPTR